MKETRITVPEGYEVDKIETQDGHIVVTFREKERKLPKSWEEFCEMFPLPLMFATTKTDFDPYQDYLVPYYNRLVDAMSEFTTDRATAEAVLSLCQLIQLRNAYNGDWMPEWKGYCTNCRKYTIEFNGGEIETSRTESLSSSPLYFKTKELRDEFLRNFRDLIEKIKPLYGIKKGGEE